MRSVLDLSKSSICLYWFAYSFSFSGEFNYFLKCWNNVPCLQVTGGGGYTKENVARCWTVETGVLLDTELPNGTDYSLLVLLLFILSRHFEEMFALCVCFNSFLMSCYVFMNTGTLLVTCTLLVKCYIFCGGIFYLCLFGMQVENHCKFTAEL